MSWKEALRLGWGRLSERSGSDVRGSEDNSSGAEWPPGDSPGEEELAVYLQRLRVLTRTWAGEPLGESGLLRVLHAAGPRPPLFWCYNGQEEFGRMASGLGPEQPLVGMRSLNKAAPTGVARLPLARALADRYADLLLEAMEFERCAVGGNCQSAAIATRVAHRLRRAGKRVDLLLTLDATPPEPVPGRVAMLFGQDSEAFNPFFRTPRPEVLWRAIHGEPSWTIVPGAHGQYFSAANLDPLCEAIRRHLGDARDAAAPAAEAEARLVIRAVPRGGVAGTALVLRAEVKAARGRGPFVVLGLWFSESHGLWAPPAGDVRAIQRIEAGRPADLSFPTPEMPGRWTLRLALCQERVGPVGWARDRDPRLSLELDGAAVPA